MLVNIFSCADPVAECARTSSRPCCSLPCSSTTPWDWRWLQILMLALEGTIDIFVLYLYSVVSPHPLLAASQPSICLCILTAMYRRWCILSLCVVSAVVTHDFSARPVAAAWQPSTVKHSYPAKPAAVLGSTTSVAESAIEQFIFRRNTNGTAPEPTCRDSSHHLCPNKQYCCPSGQACTVNKETNGRECKTKQCIDLVGVFFWGG